jgi:hypothetical protein
MQPSLQPFGFAIRSGTRTVFAGALVMIAPI